MSAPIWPRIVTDESLYTRWLPTPPPASPSPNHLTSSTSSDCDPIMTEAVVDALTSMPEEDQSLTGSRNSSRK